MPGLFSDEKDCKCIICEREFAYGDEWSPSIRDDIWARIIKFYNLVDIEAANRVLFYYWYDLAEKNYGTKKYKDYVNRANEHHTFICFPCMEKALGRKLTRNDLIAENVPLNREFEKFYFNN